MNDLHHVFIAVDTPTDSPVLVSSRVLDTAPIGMVVTTADGRILWANDALASLLGDAREGLVGTCLYERVLPDEVPAKQQAVDDLVAGRVERFEREERWHGAGGQLRWVSVSALVATTPDGMIMTVDGSPCLIRQVLDITDRKTTTLALERSNDDLTQFAYVASHDLSEPLRVVAGHVELLARRYQDRLDETANSYIAFAVDGCNRMRQLIDDLLLYARAGAEGGGDEPVDLAVVAADVVASLDPDVQTWVDIGELPTVTGSVSAHRQVIGNLVTNAVKFGRPGTPVSIVVDAQRGSESWCIRVADNGLGIAPQYRDRVFDIFGRLNRREDYPGTGIGLAVCRRLVTLRGGEIWVEDGPAGGARFCFTIPDLTVGRP